MRSHAETVNLRVMCIEVIAEIKLISKISRRLANDFTPSGISFSVFCLLIFQMKQA